MLKVEGQRLCRVPENDWLCLQEQYKRIDVTEKCTQPPNNISALFSSSDGFSLDTEDLSILLLRGVCCHLRHLVVDAPELPGPACIIEERSEVKAVVIRTVAVRVVGRRHCGHLVAVHRVHPEEVLHLLGHLCG